MTDELGKTSSAARRSAVQRRESIIAAARSLFAKHGFHGTGMAQIARASEVLVGQIYRDFAGKEDLMAAIVERDVSELLDDPELAAAMETGEAASLNNWVRRFIADDIDHETRSVLADILSEGTRNPRVSAIMVKAYACLHERLVSAANIWTADPAKEKERHEIADLILTAAGAVLHRHIYGLYENGPGVAKLLDLVEAEIAKLSSAAA